jgi:hypothetical protein
MLIAQGVTPAPNCAAHRDENDDDEHVKKQTWYGRIEGRDD